MAVKYKAAFLRSLGHMQHARDALLNSQLKPRGALVKPAMTRIEKLRDERDILILKRKDTSKIDEKIEYFAGRCKKNSDPDAWLARVEEMLPWTVKLNNVPTDERALRANRK